MNTEDVSKKIEYLRKQKGYTYKDLGDFLGISGDAVRKAIKNKRLKIYYADKLSELFGVKENFLETEEYADLTNKAEEVLQKYGPQPTGISLLELRDDIKADLLELKKSTAKKQHIQGLTNSIAENFEDVTRALLKMLEHNEKVEEFMDQIDLESLKKATKQLNQNK